MKQFPRSLFSYLAKIDIFMACNVKWGNPKYEVVFFVLSFLQALRRSTESSLRKRERRLARISLLIVLIFIICHSIKNIPSMFEILGHDPRVRCSYYRQPMLQLLIHSRQFQSAPSCFWLVTSSSPSTAVSTFLSIISATAGRSSDSSSDSVVSRHSW